MRIFGATNPSPRLVNQSDTREKPAGAEDLESWMQGPWFLGLSRFMFSTFHFQKILYFIIIFNYVRPFLSSFPFVLCLINKDTLFLMKAVVVEWNLEFLIFYFQFLVFYVNQWLFISILYQSWEQIALFS